MGTHVSIPATVCYEGEGGLIVFKKVFLILSLNVSGILVVQVQWRGKTYVGTLINSGNQNRYKNNEFIFNLKKFIFQRNKVCGNEFQC